MLKSSHISPHNSSILSRAFGNLREFAYWNSVRQDGIIGFAAVFCPLCLGPQIVRSLDSCWKREGDSFRETVDAFLSSVIELLRLQFAHSDIQIDIIIVSSESSHRQGFLIGSGAVWGMDHGIQKLSPDESLLATHKDTEDWSSERRKLFSMLPSSYLTRQGREGGTYFPIRDDLLIIMFTNPIPNLEPPENWNSLKNEKVALLEWAAKIGELNSDGFVAVCDLSMVGQK